ncbi:hypothetical protein M0R45_029876 [Rubus argutus]|uniref:Uncharacterized protein n=1 Tax=Rubus argutus TaxID=59490 RepID=A0AAW1W8Z2_RUBAR
MNLSSHAAVSVQRHWLSGEVHARFASILQGERGTASEFVQCGMVVTCGAGSEGGGVAGEGGELAAGGHGRNAFEREGRFGNFAKGFGGQNRKKGEERAGGKEEIPGVFGEEEGKEREEDEGRRDIRYSVCRFWGPRLFHFLVIYFVQMICVLHFFFSLSSVVVKR